MFAAGLPTALFRVLQRHRMSRMGMRERGDLFKRIGLCYCRGWQAGDPEKGFCVHCEFEGSLEAEQD